MIIKTIDTVTICGMKGTGKSTLGRMIGAKLSHAVIYDPLFEHGALGVVVHNPKDIGNLDRVVIQPVNDTIDFFEKVCMEVWKRNHLVFIVDEIDTHEDTYHLTPWFGRVLKLGRHKGIGGLYITRRPANMNTTIPALSDHIFCFRLVHPRDIEYLQDFIGDSAQKVKTLPDFYYLHYDHKSTTFGRTVKLK